LQTDPLRKRLKSPLVLVYRERRVRLYVISSP